MNLFNIKQIYTSRKLKYYSDIEDVIKTNYNLKEYSNKNQNLDCLFVGLFFKDELNLITDHKSKIYLLLDGGEDLNLVRNLVGKLYDTLSKGIKLLTVSKEIYEKLEDLDINLVDISCNQEFNNKNSALTSIFTFNNKVDPLDYKNYKIYYIGDCKNYKELINCLNSCSYIIGSSSLIYQMLYKSLSTTSSTTTTTSSRFKFIDEHLFKYFSQRDDKYNVLSYIDNNSKIINIVDKKILAINYEFKNNLIYSVKIKNFKSSNLSIFNIYLLSNSNSNLIKLADSDLEPRYSVNINYVDLKLYNLRTASYLMIMSSNLNNSFSLENITIDVLTRQELTQESKVSRILDIPEPKIYKHLYQKRFKVGSIMDIFTHTCFSYELDLYPVTQDNFKEVIDSNKLDFFIFESAWHGNNSNWSNMLVNFDATSITSSLNKLLEYINLKKIPKIFYNKEDPVNFDVFKNFAQNFTSSRDLVVTTDQESVEKYKQLNVSRVFSFPFCCQPIIHNPVDTSNISTSTRLSKIFFPCAYYGSKYPERCKQMDNMLDKYFNYIDLYDRQLIFTKQTHQIFSYADMKGDYEFPKRFNPLVRGFLDYHQVVSLYKKYKYVMNANTVTDSSTMFSRRIIEAAACGACIISNSSLGTKNILGDNIVNYLDTSRVEKLLKDDLYRRNISKNLTNIVFKNFTYKILVDKFISSLNLSNVREDKNKICCLLFMDDVKIKNKDNYVKILTEFKYFIDNYKVLLVSDSYKSDFVISSKDISSIDKTYDFYILLSSNVKYSNDYIEDMLLADLYTQADIFTRSSSSINKFTNRDILIDYLVVRGSIITKFLDKNIRINIKNYIRDRFTGENIYA